MRRQRSRTNPRWAHSLTAARVAIARKLGTGSSLLAAAPVRFAAVALLLVAGTLARADEGMWLFSKPPAAILKSRYGFTPSRAWLDHVQKSCVRISTGGSGSIVSPGGLVMTNHHVGADMLEKLSTPEKDLIETGFYAPTPADEPPCPEIEVLALWSTEDVTDRVEAAVEAGMSVAEANTARRAARTTIEQEETEATNLKCDVVTLYQGGRYRLYRYKRYTDVRLVMAPSKGIAAFGGDTDNFEYPRYCLDMCFFRIYEDGKPLRTENYLAWSPNGSSEGDLVFVAGHPGRTERMFTVANLAFLRDVRYPAVLNYLRRREVRLQSFRDRSDENRRIAEGDYAGIQNARKLYTGLYEGILDPSLLAAKADAERKLREAVAAHPEWQERWGGAWDQVAAAMKTYAGFYPRFLAMGGSGLRLGGDLFGIARNLVRLAAEKEKPNEERLREYRESALDQLERRLYSPAPLYPALEIERMASSLAYLAEQLGAEDPFVVRALGGKAPLARAADLVTGTKLGDIEVRKALAAGGREAIEASDDPMIRLVRDLDAESRALRRRYEDEVQSVVSDAYAKIAAAKFAIEGETNYPDATFTLRLAFGTVKGYREAGRDIPAYTRFAGLYDRWEQRHKTPPFDLPERWAAARTKLDLTTPFDFVCTADIIGGNSGSPVIDREGRVVGLIFDGNLQSLIGDLAYTDTQARAVAVDSRAIIEAMRKVCGAGALADEIQGAAASGS